MPAPISRTPEWQRQFGQVRPYMQQAWDRGLSFAQFYDAAGWAGLTYSRDRMRQDWQAVGAVYPHELQIRALRPTTTVPFQFTTLAYGRQSANFLALVEYTYTDSLTGEDRRGHRMIESTLLHSAQNYEEYAASLYSANEEYADPTARSFTLRSVFRRQDLEQ